MKKLEIGPEPGKRIGDDWQTLDLIPDYNADVIADINKPLDMIEDNTYDLIYASHILEHVPWFKSVNVLKELFRILKPGGIVEIWVPDFEKIVQTYKEKRIKDSWFMKNPEHDFMQWVNGRIFAHDREESNIYNWHKSLYDESHLRNCLEKAGFKDLKRLEKPRALDHGWINLGMSGMK
ncbi:methyltransferase domain-containing protein [Candidatus Woesearchaeota archaeon]|nr:methyltransferase domain-containing protein [Candidatus Woesearchaeota archaeon]